MWKETFLLKWYLHMPFIYSHSCHIIKLDSKFLWIEKCQLAKTQVVWKNITVQKYLNGSYFVQLYYRHILNLLMCSYIPRKPNHSMTIYIKGHWSNTPEVIPFPVSNYSFSFKTHSVIQIVNLFISNKRNSTIICSVQDPSFSFFSILIFSILVTPLLPTTGLTKEFPLAPSRYISCTWSDFSSGFKWDA